MKIALVHDWLNIIGGAERVLIELHKIFPKAPVYALFYNKKFVREFFPDTETKTSYLHKIPFITKLYKYLFFLMPSAIESFDLSDFDVVISSSVIFSKGLVLKPKTRHICYCYSPTRFLWDRHSEYENRGALATLSRHLLRIWDRQASDRVDEFVAISKHVQSRIKKYYGKQSKLIYPPTMFGAIVNRGGPRAGTPVFGEGSIGRTKSVVDNGISIAWRSSKTEPVRGAAGTGPRHDFYLIVSRLFPHKNLDVAIDAFNKLRYELIIIGDGPAKKDLKNMAGKNIKIL